LVESFSVPACIITAIQGGGEEEAVEMVKTMLAEYQVEEQSLDQTDLLKDILESHVSLGSGKQASVSQILSNPSFYSEVADQIERHGVSLVAAGSDPNPAVDVRAFVFFSA